jgi:EmrB/QacA subfamily drug resistance transporter
MSPSKKKKWWIFFVTTSGTSLVFLDNTVMPVALPSIQKEMLFNPVALVWVVNAYLLSLTALLLIGGRLSDMFGKRALFVWGLTLFGIGSVLAAFSHAKWLLLLGRVVQGSGGALTIPTTGALLIASFPEGERARAIGINTGISSVFLILGPAVGGFLTQYISWRSIFFLNFPIVAFGIVMSFLILKPGHRKNETFHFTGALAMFIGVITLVVGLMQGNDWGWTSPLTLILLLVSPLFFALFYWISTHTHHPIIDFHFFRNRLFTVANISLFLTQIIVMATVLWAIYFQDQLHYSPAQTGLLIFIAAFPVFMMAPIGGYFADRFGPRTPLLSGFAILTFALIWLMFTASTKKILMLLPGLLGFGCGMPLIMSPTVALALSQVNPEKLGAASGISMETRQLASTMGIALMTAIYHGVLKNTGSHAEAFSSISLFAGVLAVAGFWIIFFTIRKTNHLHISGHS